MLTNQIYNLTLIIDVPQIPSGSVQNFTVTLTYLATGPTPVTPFWYLENSYTGITPQTKAMIYNRTITFRAVQGELKLGVLFEIPNSVITHNYTANGVFLTQEFPRNITLVAISWGNAGEGQVSYWIENQDIESFSTNLSEVKALKVPSNYQGIVTSEVNLASQLASEGLYQQADQLLKSVLTGTYLPPPPPPSMTPVYALAGTTAIGFALAAFGFLSYIKAKSRGEDYSRLLREAVTELTSIGVTAGRFDRNLAQRIESLVNRLKGGGK